MQAFLAEIAKNAERFGMKVSCRVSPRSPRSLRETLRKAQLQNAPSLCLYLVYNSCSRRRQLARSRAGLTSDRNRRHQTASAS
jgi:hypothetical protein